MLYKENETTINPKMTNNTDPDRLSNLPDSILTTILSFLNPREIVQTCVLSKKWRNLWTFVPCLNFESDDFIIQDPNLSEKREFNSTDLERFQNFVSTFLHLRNNWTDVQFFRLQKPQIWNLNKICAGFNNVWIRYVLNHNVKKLVLYGHECIDLPARLFTCESLEDLSMDLISSKDREFIVPDFVFLPKLRKLYLSDSYVKGNYLEKLIFGCPNLESLTLRCCNIKLTNNISFRNLNKLFFEDCDYIGELGPSSFYISAPCVEYLKFWGNLGCGLVIKDMSRVKKAKIEFRDGFVHELYNCEIICSLLGVENLNIEAYCVLKDVLEGEIPNCKTFHNMKKLTLNSSCMHCDFGPLSSFLKHCLNLEILTLYHDEQLCEHWNVDHTEKLKDENLGEIEKFGCDKLRLVEIVYYEGDLDVDWVIRRLMRSTIGINNVQIILRKTNLDLDADLDDMHEHFDLEDVDRLDFSRFV